MDCIRTGLLIGSLRKEKKMTQKQLAEQLYLSDKTISKWERGLGLPDIAVLSELSRILEVNIEEMLSGDLALNDFVGGNMKQSKYYVCPSCGNVTLCTGNAAVSCCGRKLDPLDPAKAKETEKLKVEQIEDDWHITSSHAMKKDHYISFVAFATGERIQLIKQYPEWDLNVRIQKRGHGMLIWYDTQEGLLYQLL